MATIIITTDFSPTSRHSLDYACQLLAGKDLTFDLIHTFPIQVAYSAQGIALTAMRNDLDLAEERMNEEVGYVNSNFPGIKITGRIVTGSFLESLRQEVKYGKPMFVVLGTDHFADLYFEEEPLDALRSLPAPVLFVPANAALKPIRNVAYACNYAGVGAHTPVADIIDWIRLLDAKLKVFHTDTLLPGQDAKQTSGEQWLKERLAPVHPEFNWVQDTDVLLGISSFIASHDIDCVLMVPKKYGMWDRLFHKSRTKALARLNKVPIIAFHPQNV